MLEDELLRTITCRREKKGAKTKTKRTGNDVKASYNAQPILWQLFILVVSLLFKKRNLLTFSCTNQTFNNLLIASQPQVGASTCGVTDPEKANIRLPRWSSPTINYSYGDIFSNGAFRPSLVEEGKIIAINAALSILRKGNVRIWWIPTTVRRENTVSMLWIFGA